MNNFENFLHQAHKGVTSAGYFLLGKQKQFCAMQGSNVTSPDEHRVVTLADSQIYAQEIRESADLVED